LITLAFKAFHYPAQENNTYTSHFHNSLEFLIPESAYFLQTETGELSVSYGDLIFLRANTLHNQIQDAPPCPRYVLHVDKNTISSLSTPDINILERLEGMKNCRLDIRGKEAEFIRILSFLSDPAAMVQKSELSAAVALMRFFELLLEHIDYDDSAASQGTTSRRSVELVHNAQQYILENLAQPLSLDSISSDLHVSKFYLSHLFRQLTGYGVKEYISHCRLECACELLRKGASVEEAQSIFNIQNSNYFAHLFKKEIGISPAEYSKRYSQKLILK